MFRTRILLASLLLASCGNEVDVGDLHEVMSLPLRPPTKLDILFVVDNSPTMIEEQQSLASAAARILDAYSFNMVQWDLHIGVVTTDMGTAAANPGGDWGPDVGTGESGSCSGHGEDGALRRGTTPGVMRDGYIAYGPGIGNYEGTPAATFSELVQVGDTGCAFEQPLHAMRRALESPANRGFLRADANLAVVIVANEDDCSFSDPQFTSSDPSNLGPLQSFRCTRYGVTCDDGGANPADMSEPGQKRDCHSNERSPLMSSVSSYVDALRTLKADPNMVMVGAIVGDPAPVNIELRAPKPDADAIPALGRTCTYVSQAAEQIADPAVRIAEFVASFPARGVLSSICNADLHGPLASIQRGIDRMMGDPCIETPLLDTSRDPGIQPYCEVIDGPPGYDGKIPQCRGNDGRTCWSIVPDAERCAAVVDNLRLEVKRPSMPQGQVYSHLRCLTR